MATPNISALVDYYINLLIIQYNNKPKARKTIGLLVDVLLSNGIIFSVQDGYDIETAIGLQLDVLGKYIGSDRFYQGQDLTGYFSLALYDDPDEGAADKIGFADYVDAGVKTGKFLTYDDVLSQQFALTDSEFRTLIKLKILINNSNASNSEIDAGLYLLFGTTLLMVDNLDMTLTYIVDPSIYALINVAHGKDLLPRPMGVSTELLVGSVITDDYGQLILTDDGQIITT